MNRDYLAQQLDEAWWAAVVADLLYPVQVAITEATRPCFTSLGGGSTGRRPGLGRRWA